MFDVIILAIIQALTEFIPVSSSGHLVALEETTSIESFLAFDVILHAGTLIALIIYFWPNIRTILYELRANKISNLARNLIITTIPAAVAGFLFRDFFTDSRQLRVVILMLVIVGLVMIFIDQLFKKSPNKITKLTEKNAAIIGIGQTLALIPGTSRSGITMIAGRSQGLNNREAAEYAFLAGIPIILGATIKVLSESPTINYIQKNPDEVLVGVFIAAGLGWLALKVLLRYLSNNGLAVFGWYRIALAGVLFVIFLNQ